jgi:Universal stress protein UspA and related nucleotide-binding proteins
MKKILVPTDFSENSKVAFQYAIDLAQQLDVQVTVANIYHPSAIVVNEYPVPIDVELLHIFRDELDNFVTSGFDQSMEGMIVSNMVDQRIEIGFAADKLVELSKTGEFDLIIMGATGETGLLEKVFGKVSLSVAERAGCPVLLIPSNVSFRPTKKIMYATNFESINMNILLKIEKLSKNLNAKVHLVHVSANKKEDNTKETFLQKLPSLDFEMDTITSDSIANGLEQYASENNMDWMVIVKPHRNFWQRLTHKSQTNPIVINPQIPLMVMH